MPRQVPVNGVAFVALVVVLAATLVGCGSTGPASPPAAATATAAVSSGTPTAAASASSEVEQLLAQAMSAPIDVSDPGLKLDLAEQGMKDYMRGASGVAALLGPNGAATLSAIDAAERQAVAALIARVRAQGALPRAGVRLASVATRALPGGSGQDPTAAGGESLFGAFMFTMMAPELYARGGRNASGNLDRQTLTEEMTTSDGSRIQITLQPSLTGSKLNAEVKVTISVTGPPAYTEEATGTLSVDLCPDANGNVPLELSLGGGFSLLGGGMQYHVAMTATGHTDDSGKLAGMDVQADGSLASQPQSGQGGPGTVPMYVELRAGYSLGLAGGEVTNATGSAPRYSSQVDEAFVRSAIAMTASMGSIATVLGFQSAERLWTTGYCVEITVPEMDAGGSKTVAPSSTTPFTANVRHKFEGADLVVPVTATLGSGGVSVSPSGNPVPAPAAFLYKAPDRDRQTATVNLETHSKRGIATLAVTFMTGTSAYSVSGMYFGSMYKLTGTICDLTVTFKLNADASGIRAKGVFTFQPEGSDGGTWSYKGKMGPSGGALSYKGSGGYTVIRPADSVAGAVPLLRMTGGTDWTITAPIVGTMPLGEGVHLGPGDDVKLVPKPACTG